MRRANLSFILLFLTASYIFTSCDDPVDFDLQGTAGQGNIPVISDTFPLFLSTQRHTPVPTNNLQEDLLGVYNDPVFGKTTAILFTQYRMRANRPNFGASPILDSIVLYITYANKDAYTGKLSTQQTWNVYELDEDLIDQKDYFAETDIKLKNGTIGTRTGSFKTEDTVIRIKLSNAFGQKILNTDLQVFQDNTTFLNVFKGLAIVPDSNGITTGEGAIINVAQRRPRTKLALHYNGDELYEFLLDDAYNVRINAYRHNYEGTAPGQQLKVPSNSYTKAYLHAMGGLLVNVQLPNLKIITENGRPAVYKAELHFPKAADAVSTQTPPPALFLFPRNSEGQNKNVPEDLFFDYYDGNWNATKNNYTIGLTRYMQNLLLAYKNGSNPEFHGFNLFIPAEQPVVSSGIELATQEATAGAKPVLILTYSKL